MKSSSTPNSIKWVCCEVWIKYYSVTDLYPTVRNGIIDFYYSLKSAYPRRQIFRYQVDL